jgi:hypothetical protein
MKTCLSRVSPIRVAGATVMTAAALVAGLPAAAQAGPAVALDTHHGGRSVSVTVENNTRESFRYSGHDSDLSEGNWVDEPARFIDARRDSSFQAESDGRGGVEGTVVYRSGSGDVTITFDNSGRGHGDYDCEPSRRFDCDVDVDQDGRDADVTVTISRR